MWVFPSLPVSWPLAASLPLRQKERLPRTVAVQPDHERRALRARLPTLLQNQDDTRQGAVSEFHLNDGLGLPNRDADFEADLLAHLLHLFVLAQRVGHEAVELLVFGNLH